MKVEERARARRLRRDGKSIKQIARTVGVSQSSVSAWVRDIELTSEQRETLARNQRVHPNLLAAAAVRSERFRDARRAAQRDGRLYARAGDPLHAAGCMLYWAEGGKHRNTVKLTNSDPEVLRLFLRFLRAYFVIRDDRIRVTCNLFVDHLERKQEIEQFWLQHLALPPTSLCKSTVNTYSKYSQKKRRNRLPYATCRLSVSDTAIVQHIYGAIQEYGDFDRPEWLDAVRSEVPRVRS